MELWRPGLSHREKLMPTGLILKKEAHMTDNWFHFTKSMHLLSNIFIRNVPVNGKSAHLDCKLINSSENKNPVNWHLQYEVIPQNISEKNALKPH